MRTLWNLVEKLAPIIALEEALGDCFPISGLEDFFDAQKAEAARHKARELACGVARRHYRRQELEMALVRLDEQAENDFLPRKIRKVYWAVAGQIRKRHGKPQTTFATTPEQHVSVEDDLFALPEWGTDV